MFLFSVIANFVFLFLLICVVIKPNIKHVMIGASFAVPYLFISWLFLFSKYPQSGKPGNAVVSLLVLSNMALYNYSVRRTKEKNGLVFLFIIFLFLFWSALLILLPFLTK